MERKPLWQQHMEKCRHFNGMINKTCDAGIEYEAVRDATIRPYGYPCLIMTQPCATTCALADFPTEEESKEYERQAHDDLRRTFQQIADGICPHCQQTMTKRQVGPCVYAEPCGHRLYQGRIK